MVTRFRLRVTSHAPSSAGHIRVDRIHPFADRVRADVRRVRRIAGAIAVPLLAGSAIEAMTRAGGNEAVLRDRAFSAVSLIFYAPAIVFCLFPPPPHSRG